MASMPISVRLQENGFLKGWCQWMWPQGLKAMGCSIQPQNATPQS